MYLLKNSLFALIVFLVLVPPMQVHTDVLVYNDAVENHLESVNKVHGNALHKNDSEDDKDIEHHHHCNNIEFHNVYIPAANQLSITDYRTVKENVTFYQSLHYFSYLSKVFQPPKYS